ncbi:hypothetical protein M9Y10_023224 [Tritrichomonas musculus]|uniref:DH domain-containing protein n=1 Tax=Tritrichomonas musculus TaxID=1915356 RepID=A0ABR2KVH8_9EUKA
MQEKNIGSSNDNENFVIFLADSKLPIYKKAELIKGKKVNDIKTSLKLKKEYTLAIRTPTFIQYADPIDKLTDDFPKLIHNQKNDFSYAIQIINIDDINSVIFIFQCEVDNVLPGTSTPLSMPKFLVHFYYDEFYKKSGKYVLSKIVSNFNLPIENPQLFINDQNIDLNRLVAIEIFKKLRSDKNKNVFKCHLTDQALEFMEKRVTLIQELITNETIYLEQLNYLFNSFTTLIKRANVFKEKSEKYQDFKNCLQKIFKYHTSFYLELKSMKVEYGTMISKAFLKLGDSFSINQDLIQQYAKFRLLMSEIKNNSDIKYIKTSVFSLNKIDFNKYIEVPYRQPLMYIKTLQKIMEVTPKSHIDYRFLRISELKMKIICSQIESNIDKMKNSFELINLINRIDQTAGNTISITGQSLKMSFDIIIRSKESTTKRPGMVYLFKDKILCTFRNGFGKNIKETVIFYNKIKNQAFVISSDLKMDSIIFIADSQNNYNVTFESKEKRDEFLTVFREVRENLIVTKPFKIYAEEVIPSNFVMIPLPQIYGLSAVALSDTLLFFTGGMTEGKKEHCSPFIIFDSKTNESMIDYEFLTPSANMRMTYSSSQDKGETFVSLYLFGGRKNNHVFLYDQAKQWIELPGNGSFTRIKHSFVTYNDDFFVFGGLDEQNQPQNDLWKYDLKNKKWEKIETKGKNPPSRFDHSAVIYKNIMIIHGGQCNSDKYSDIWMFDFIKLEWSQVKLRKNSSIIPRSGHAAIIINQFMVVFGGDDYNNLPFALNIENMKVIKLKFVGNYVYGMKNFAAAVVLSHDNNDKQIVCFGGFNNDNSVIINSFTKLHLPQEIVNPD